MANRHRTSNRKTLKVPARARRKSQKNNQKNNGTIERVVSELFRRTLLGRRFLYRIIGLNRSASKSPTWISKQSTTIMRPRSEIYREWRTFEQFPAFMENLLEVRVTGKRHSRWIAESPIGARVTWDNEIIDERRNDFIHWRTVSPSQIKMEGKVFFSDAPQDKGTEVRVILDYWMPGGKLGKTFAFMFGKDPDQQSRENLRRFKRLMETGEIPTAEKEFSTLIKAA